MKTKTTHHRLTVITSGFAAMAVAIGFGISSAHAQITPVGGIARDFVITNHATGGPLRLYDYPGRVILLEFWAYWCWSCKQAAEDIQPGIAQYYRTNGGNQYGVPVQVISISLDASDPAEVNRFIQAYGLELVGDDLFGEAWSQFGESGIPQLTVINGTSNSTNYQQWEVVQSKAGYSQNLVNALRIGIDSVRTVPPICTLVSPIGVETNSAPVTLTATVTTNGVVTKKIEFYSGATLLGSVTEPPYTMDWNIPVEGAKTVFARAHYGNGFSADSTPVTFTVGPTPPNIAVQPTNRTVSPGGSNSFNVVVTGTGPITYQWQKSQINLSNGGHYSGCTTPTLTIVNCDSGDSASYRCVVTNACGTNISNTATLTVPSVNTPPRIVQQPSNQTVAPGGTTSFFIVANGSDPLSFQWQKNNSNLTNGGNCSGVTTDTLTICSADTNDVANYRCVVTNAYGCSNSATATLSLAVVQGCLTIANADFEGGFTNAGGGTIANNWTEWETDPGVIIGYDDTTVKHGGDHAQRLRVWGGVLGSSGGIYQRIPVTAGKSYTVGVWIYAGDAATSCSLGVHPAAGTNANSGVTWSTPTTNVAWVEKNVTTTATTNYITVFYKVASSDSVKRTGWFDDATPGGSNGPIQLAVQRSGNDLMLSWPECPEARLERTGSLSNPGVWLTVTNQVNIGGGQKSVIFTPTANAGYFRLVRE